MISLVKAMLMSRLRLHRSESQRKNPAFKRWGVVEPIIKCMLHNATLRPSRTSKSLANEVERALAKQFRCRSDDFGARGDGLGSECSLGWH